MPGAVTPFRKHYLTPQLTFENAAEALRRHRGVVSDAAKALRVSRPTLYSFMKEHPELQELRYELEEELLDIAERTVAESIEAGDLLTARWFLERRGKHRGYSTRAEVNGPASDPVEFPTVERSIIDPPASAE